MQENPSNCDEEGIGLLLPVLQVPNHLKRTTMVSPRDRFGDLGIAEREKSTEWEEEDELYQTAIMEGSGQEDLKEEQRKRLSLFSGKVRERQSPGFGVIKLSKRGIGGSAIVQGRRSVQGGHQGQALTDGEVFQVPGVPMGNLRKAVRSPRKNKSGGGMLAAQRQSDVATEVLPKFGPNPPSRIPDFKTSQACCIPRHPDLRPAVQVRET